MSAYVVKFAHYGVLAQNNANPSQAADVRATLQQLLDAARGAAPGTTVQITNGSMRGDPAPGIVKHFAAVVAVNGSDYLYSCQEGQSIDFQHGTPALPSAPGGVLPALPGKLGA